MSKILYICSKNVLPENTKSKLQDICLKLEPDNLTLPTPEIKVDKTIAYAIINPERGLLRDKMSVALGRVFGDLSKWAEKFYYDLEGSFALFRNTDNHLEILTDFVASRTLWYYNDKNVFLASTSQRAIVMYLGSFEFNINVVSWMLSTGSLGPFLSWDKRIKQVPANCSVTLSKREWELREVTGDDDFEVLRQGNKDHEQMLEGSLKSAIASLNIDLSEWILPLSGGYDSRGILCLLNESGCDLGDLHSITWGDERAPSIKGNDAYIARDLAKSLNVQHTYYHTHQSDEAIETIINRFICLGEGRIDHLSGYMDGFKIWKTLFEDGIQGIIRGDEGFGWVSVSSSLTVRHRLACSLCSDFANLQDFSFYGLPEQEMPDVLQRKAGETYAVWRDRLYQQYRIPTLLAALSDLKLSYIEIINPFLTKSVIQSVRKLPDKFRTEKILFKKIINNMSPNIKYATQSALNPPKNILRDEEFVYLMRDELSSDKTKSIIPPELLTQIVTNIKSQSYDSESKNRYMSMRGLANRVVPKSIQLKVQNGIYDYISLPHLDQYIMAFRIFLVSKMNEILSDDANHFKNDTF